MLSSSKHIWIRAETKHGEQRVPIIPTEVRKLIEKGYHITVERSPNRCIHDENYRSAGATMVEAGSWVNAPKDTLIIGLKELPHDTVPLYHRHLYFGHCFKGQPHAMQLLDRFKQGGGTLYDLEYLTNEKKKRMVSFGRIAGMIGMALALLVWVWQQKHPYIPYPPIDTYGSTTTMRRTVQQLLRPFKDTGLPTILIIGANGACGSGAVLFAKQLNIGLSITQWTKEETMNGGPFHELLQKHIVVNCIQLNASIPSFLNGDTIASPSRVLSVLSDISCDSLHPFHPFPFYTKPTTLDHPTERIIHDTIPLDVIAIDHLPTIVPIEASAECSWKLAPFLVDHESCVWKNMETAFLNACSA